MTTNHRKGDAEALRLLVEEHKALGGYWFAPQTMAYFSSRIETGLLPGDHFVSSEQAPDSPYRDEPMPRLYSVRRFEADRKIVDTLGDFQEFETLEAALAAAEEAAR